MSLMIAMPGPPLPEKDSAGAAQRDALPELPQLTRLLAAARPLPRTSGWRAGALAFFNRGVEPGWADAAVAAQGAPELAGQPLCFAAPLYLEAGISRVHLPPHGLLALDEAEREALRSGFNQEFADSGLRLHVVPGAWLLAGSVAAAARDAAPEQLLGEPLARVPASDAAERVLRRLGTEVEMWLAAHPLNAARSARRQLPVNNFWFWGGVQAASLAPLAEPPRSIRGPAQPDPWLAGLARHAGAEVQAAHGWEEVRDLTQALVVPAGETAAARSQWEELEARWFAPMAQALGTRRLPPLRLQIGRTVWQLPDRSPLRWLRRARLWHEALRE